MSTSDLEKFPGGTQDKGINTFDPDIGAEITWDEATTNVTGGVRRGVGPRYGVAPLAGHSNTIALAGNETNGLMKSENTSGAGLTFREQVYACIPVTMAPYDGAWPKANRQFYVWLVGLVDGSNYTLDACISATLASSVNKQASTLVAGLAESSYRQESPLVRRHKTEFLNLPQIATPTAANMQSALRSVGSRNWTPWAHISVSGKRIPYQWMLGDRIVAGDATHTPSLTIWTVNVTAAGILAGAPSEIVTRESTDNATRVIQVYCLDVNGYKLDIQYSARITNADTTAVQAYGSGIMYQAVTGAKGGGSTSYSSTGCALINDPGSYTNSKHEAILFAGEIPLAVIYQDWLVAVKGMMPRWIDLSGPCCIPRLLGPNLLAGPNGRASSMPTAVPSQEAANTGILRKDTTYDFGFSSYNKLIDYETNVVYGCTHTIATDDLVAINFDQLGGGDDNVWENFQNSSTNNFSAFPWEFSNATTKSDSPPFPRGFSLNDYEYRLYYRESGTNEWLPGGSYDAAQYWFYYAWASSPFSGNPTFCTGPVANLPGGQANGFIDYSPLPKQRYICTVVYQNRAFWWSEKTMQFSLQNNIYAYPTRNTVAAQTGKWRGGIVHIRSGEVEQTSRLVCFGDSSYVGVFTGVKTQQNVRISSDIIGQFEIDGSDFQLDYLCDATAFSFRAAAVARGVLYFWGPQGVYQDDGVSSPQKISGIYEPEILQFVDMGRDSEVHCVFNKRCSEVIWFYPPKETDATYPTYLLIYNVENGKFYNGKMRFQVDSAQVIQIENDDTPDDVDGERILIHGRPGTADGNDQRTYYFDDLVAAGEQGPTRELTVQTVSTPTPGTLRLTLATGSVGITAGDIAVNDLICVQNAKGYAPSLTLGADMIAKITAINNGSNWIEIALPTGASFDASATLTGQTAFPIYHKKPTAAGLHGITYNVTTNYWLPGGLSSAWSWLYLYFLFKYGGIPTPTDVFTGLPSGAQVDLTYRTLVCAAALTDTLKLRNNSAGHCQIHHPLRNAGRAANGQALKYALSGIHIGNPWTLEYLEAHCKAERGFTLKEFEG